MRSAGLAALACIPALWADDARALDPLREEVHVQASRLDVVEISFVVRDRSGAPIPGLGPDDFRLEVDGQPTRLERVTATIEASRAPLSIVFLIDVSTSMRSIERERFLGGARALLARLRPQDELMIASFADEPRIACEFSSAPALLSKALESVPRPDGGTNLGRALELAGERLESRAGHGVVVVYSDGSASAGGSIAFPVYWIVPHFQGAGAVLRNEEFRNLVVKSGGRWVLESHGMESALAEVGEELRDRYEATFVVDTRTHPRGAYQIELELATRRPGARIQVARWAFGR